MGLFSGHKKEKQVIPPGKFTYQEDRLVQIRDPKKYPSELVEHLRNFFDSIKCVERAYLVEMYDPKSGEPPHNVIGVTLKSDCKREFSDFAQEFIAYFVTVSKPGEFADLVDASDKTELSESVITSGKSFYPR